MGQEGDEIRFDLHINDRNQPQVPAPIWKKNTEGKGGGGKGKGGMDSKGKGWGSWDSWQSNGWGKGKGGWGVNWGDSWAGDGFSLMSKASQIKGMLKGMKGGHGGWGEDAWQPK